MTGLRSSKKLALYAAVWVVLTSTGGSAAPIRGIHYPLSTNATPLQQSAHDTILTLSGPIKVATTTAPTIQSHPPNLRRQFPPIPKSYTQENYQLPTGRPWMNVAGYSLLLYSFASFVLLTLMWSKSWLNGRLEPTERFLWGVNPFRNSGPHTHRTEAVPHHRHYYRRDYRHLSESTRWGGNRGRPYTERDYQAAILEHNMRGLML